MSDQKEVDWKALGLSTDEELAEIEQRMNKTEEEGVKNTLKYFDRIHDKVFKFNNILIGGYFFLAGFDASSSYYMLLVPIVNLIIIVYIEYRMMEKSRFEASIKSMPSNAITKYGKTIDRTNQYSLVILSTTAIVTLIFLAQVFFVQNRDSDNSMDRPSVELFEPVNSNAVEGEAITTDSILIRETIESNQVIIDSSGLRADTLE